MDWIGAARERSVSVRQLNKQIMWTNMQITQPMKVETDSTESTESREMPENVQAEVDEYTKKIVDLIIDDPCKSVPSILQRLRQEGLCSSERSAAHLFGGPRMFRKTRHRLEIFRWVLVTRRWEELPFKMDIQYREWEGRRRYHRKPDSNDDWASWWAPDMFSLTPFESMDMESESDMELEQERCLYRFPAGEDEDEYFKEEQDEWMSLDSDVEMMEAEG